MVHKIKEQIQQGISKDLVIDTVNSSIPSPMDPKQLLEMLESEMKNALGFPPAAITEKERPNESKEKDAVRTIEDIGILQGYCDDILRIFQGYYKDIAKIFIEEEFFLKKYG